MPDSAALAAPDAALRTTLRIGGLLLVASGALRLVQSVMWSAAGVGAVVAIVDLVLFSGALAVFAIGVGRGGSIVARRPLGMTALLLIAVWPAVERVVLLTMPPTMDNLDAVQSWGWTSLTVQLTASIVAVVAIARAGVIRGALRWAPLWGLVALVAPQVVAGLVFAAPGNDAPSLAGVLVGLGQLVGVGVPLALGILAVVRAGTRPPAEPVQVYPPQP